MPQETITVHDCGEEEDTTLVAAVDYSMDGAEEFSSDVRTPFPNPGVLVCDKVRVLEISTAGGVKINRIDASKEALREFERWDAWLYYKVEDDPEYYIKGE